MIIFTTISVLFNQYFAILLWNKGIVFVARSNLIKKKPQKYDKYNQCISMLQIFNQ